MGHGVLSKYSSSSVYLEYPFLQEHETFFQSFTLSQSDVKKLFLIFSKIDFYGKGIITSHDLFHHIGCKQDGFLLKYLNIFYERTGTTGLTFKSFVLLAWTISTMSRSDIVYFVIDLHGNEHKDHGSITLNECVAILAEMYGKGFYTDKAIKKLMDKFHDLHSAGLYIPFMKFHKFCVDHVTLFTSVYTVQDAMQRRIGGSYFWRKLRYRRLQLLSNNLIFISDVLVLSMMSKVRVVDRKFVYQQEPVYTPTQGYSGSGMPSNMTLHSSFSRKQPASLEVTTEALDVLTNCSWAGKLSYRLSKTPSDLALVDSITVEGESYIMRRLANNSVVFTRTPKPLTLSLGKELANVSNKVTSTGTSTGTRERKVPLVHKDHRQRHQQQRRVHPSQIRGFDRSQRGDLYRASSIRDIKGSSSSSVADMSGWGWGVSQRSL